MVWRLFATASNESLNRSLDWQKAQDNAGLVTLYRDLIHLRRNSDGRTRGLTGQNTEILYLDDEQKLLAFHRWELGGPGDDVLVMANFANEIQQEIPVPFPHPGRWHLRFNSALPEYGLAAAEYQSTELTVDEELAEITITPYGILIFSQNPD